MSLVDVVDRHGDDDSRRNMQFRRVSSLTSTLLQQQILIVLFHSYAFVDAVVVVSELLTLTSGTISV